MSMQDSPRHIPTIGIADRLRAARLDAGLTQEELADAIDVAKNTVTNYEARNWPRKRRKIVLNQWALRCGVPIDWLVDGREEGPGPDGPGTPIEYAPWDLNPEPADCTIYPFSSGNAPTPLDRAA